MKNLMLTTTLKTLIITIIVTISIMTMGLCTSGFCCFCPTGSDGTAEDALRDIRILPHEIPVDWNSDSVD